MKPEHQPSGLAQNIASWNFAIGAKEAISSSVERSSFQRSEIISLEHTRSAEALATLFRVIATDPNENNRESAIKALKGHGGVFVLSTLESLWFGREKARFGKGAAGTALKELGFFRNDAPVFNPMNMYKDFIGLAATLSSTTLPQRGNAAFREVVNYGMVRQQLIGFAVSDAQQIRIDAKVCFDITEAEARCTKAGLITSRLGDNALLVGGNSWPGTPERNPEQNLVFWVESASQRSPHLRIFSDGIPATTGVEDWQSAARHLVRIARWAGC